MLGMPKGASPTNAQVLEARLSKGGRVLDASDFREWLIELAEKAEQAETVEQFLSLGLSGNKR